MKNLCQALRVERYNTLNLQHGCSGVVIAEYLVCSLSELPLDLLPDPVKLSELQDDS
jgi:hypothetical protein